MNPEKLSFIKERAKDIKPTATDISAITEVEKGRSVNEDRINAVLERYETKVLTYERPNAPVGAGKILLEASQPANYSVAARLINELMQDSRCAGITLLTDSASGQEFEKSSTPLRPVRSKDEPVMADIPIGPYDVALVFDEPENTPQSVLLYSAKSVFGAKKLYFFLGGLAGEKTQRILAPDASPKMDTIDAIFVEDQLSKQLLCEMLHIPEKKIIITDSALIESLEPEKAESFRTVGREKLSVPDSAFVVLYAGFPSADLLPSGGSEDLNLHTYAETVEGVRIAARNDPSREYVLITRTHPRARNVEPSLLAPSDLPANMRVMDGDGVSYDEDIYAADVICCNPFSSEVLLAAYRGRSVVVTAYGGDRQLGELCERAYGRNTMDFVNKSGRAAFAESSQGLASVLEQHIESPSPLPKPSKSLQMRKILLGEQSEDREEKRA